MSLLGTKPVIGQMLLIVLVLYNLQIFKLCDSVVKWPRWRAKLQNLFLNNQNQFLTIEMCKLAESLYATSLKYLEYEGSWTLEIANVLLLSISACHSLVLISLWLDISEDCQTDLFGMYFIDKF